MALAIPHTLMLHCLRALARALGHHGMGLRPREAPGLSRGRCHIGIPRVADHPQIFATGGGAVWGDATHGYRKHFAREACPALCV